MKKLVLQHHPTKACAGFKHYAKKQEKIQKFQKLFFVFKKQSLKLSKEVLSIFLSQILTDFKKIMEPSSPFLKALSGLEILRKQKSQEDTDLFCK